MPTGFPALPPGIAALAVPLFPLPPIACTAGRADAPRHATRRGLLLQNPRGIRGPPKSHARRPPTNSLPGKPPRSAASPVGLHPAHPPDNNFSAHHPKRSKAFAPGHQDLPDAPAARSAAPQTLPGIHGPPKSRVGQNPTRLLRRKAPRCAAGSDPHPRACLPRSSAARHHPTSSGQSIRRPDFLPAAQTPLGSRPGIRDPPRFRLGHTPTNNPAGRQRRSFAFPAPHPLSYPRGSIAAVHHPKSREPVCRRSDCLGPLPLWRRGIPVRPTQSAFSKFAC
jgi:hypothetical protein